MTDCLRECPLKSGANAPVLLDFCAGRLAPADQATLEEHIDNCLACKEFCDGQLTVWEALDSWEAEPVSRSFDTRLLAALPRRSRLTAWFSGISWKPAIPVAAVLALYFSILTPRVPPPVSSEVQQVEQTLADLDMLEQLKLSDR